MFDELFGKSGLSLDRLQTLCEIAAKGSIGEATKGDSNRQTQFSRQISELEKYFGVSLLNRESRPHRLSDEGRELAIISRDFLGSLAHFQSKCEHQPVSLCIGAGESTIQWLLMPMLEHLGGKLPDATISMRNLRTQNIIQALNEGEIDLGLVRKNAVTKPLSSVGRWEYGYRLFIPAKKCGSLKGKLNINQLINLPLALLGGEGEFRTQLASLAKDSQAELDIRLECTSYAQIAAAISSGAYCGFLPQFASKFLSQKEYPSFEVSGFETLKRELVFAWNPKKAKLRPIVEKAIELFE